MRFPIVLIVTLAFHGTVFAQSGRSSDSGSDTRCAADVRWINSSGSVNYSRSSQVAVSLSALVHVSRGCTNSEVTFTASFLTENQEVICSGTIRQAVALASEVQTFNLEIRPFSQLDFLRWRNQPGIRGIQQGKRLVCTNLDGTADLGDNERQRASSIRLSLGVLTPDTGVAVTEAMVRVSP